MYGVKTVLGALAIGVAGLVTTGAAEAHHRNSSNDGYRAKTRIVDTYALNVRACPSRRCRGLDTIYRGDRVRVFEYRNGWARISPYFSGRRAVGYHDGYGRREPRANWVAARFLETPYRWRERRRNRNAGYQYDNGERCDEPSYNDRRRERRRNRDD